VRLQIYSDLHLERGAVAPEVGDADVIVLAGDIHTGTRGIDWAKTLDKPVIYVAGNHEFWGEDYGDHLEALRQAAAGSAVHFLENEAVIVQGVRFLGCTLWTDYANGHDAMVDFGHWMNDHQEIRAAGWWTPDNRARHLELVNALFHFSIYSALTIQDQAVME